MMACRGSKKGCLGLDLRVPHLQTGYGGPKKDAEEDTVLKLGTADKLFQRPRAFIVACMVRGFRNGGRSPSARGAARGF